MRLAVPVLLLALVAASCSFADCDVPRTYTAAAVGQTLRIESAPTADTLVIAVLAAYDPLLGVNVAPGALQASPDAAVELTYDVRQTGGGQALVPLATALRGDTLFVRPDTPLLRQACSLALFEQRVTVTRLSAPAGVRAVRVVALTDPRPFPTALPLSPRPAAPLFA